MNISIAFTTFNRTDLLYQAVEPFLKDDRISEIVISDDCSNENIIAEVWEKYSLTPKVRIYKNEVNIDCYHNKAKAVERASSDWVALLDSDNIFSVDFINRLENLWVAGLNDRTAYAPDFAKPHFDFRHLSGQSLRKENIASLIGSGSTQTMLNAMNYLVNRSEYLRIFDRHMTPVTSDSIYQNYRWLDGGNTIYVVPDLFYDHRVHSGSHYQQNVRRTPINFHDSIVNKLKSML